MGLKDIYRRIAFRYRKNICNRCKKSKSLTVHHIDENRKNNHPSNLEILCIDCHNKEHNIKTKKKSKYGKKYLKGTPKWKKK